MAKSEDNGANLDDLGGNFDDLSGNDLSGNDAELLEDAGDEPAADLEDLSAEEVPTEEAAVEPAEADLADLATEPGSAAHVEEPAHAEEEDEREPSKLPIALEIAAIFVLPVVIIVLAVMHYVNPWVGLYLFLTACVPYALWKGRRTNTVFTVFLGFVLAAELTAIFCLFKEFQRYGYDVSGRAGKQKVTIAAPNYPGATDPGSLA